MAGQCEVCGKHKTFGHNVSFSKRRTNRSFKPNTHKKRVVIGGRSLRLNICTRCLRTSTKAGRMA